MTAGARAAHGASRPGRLPPDALGAALGSGQPRVALDVRLLLPAVTAWAVDVGLLWAGASTGVLVTVAVAALLGSLGCLAVAAARPAVSAKRAEGAESPERVQRAEGPERAESPGAPARRRLPGAGPLALTLAATALVVTCLAGHDAVRTVGIIVQLAQDQATVWVEASVTGDPRPVRPRPGRRVEEQLVVVTLRVHVLQGRGLRSELDAPVLVVGDARWLRVAWLQRITATGRLSPAAPGEDTVAVLRPSGPPELVADAPLLARAADHVRERFRTATSQLPPDPAGLVPGLVLGDTSGTPPDLTDAMTTAGLTHLSAVSGSNVAIVLGAALGAAAVAGVRRRWRPVLAAFVLAGFVVLVRPEPSVLRAAVMGLVGLLGLGVARRTLGAPALAAAVVALLCWDPWLARSYGFALSVLATLGLLVFARPWGRWIGRRLPRRLARWGPALAVPLAAQAACAPVVVLLQGSVSLVAVPANLLAAPFVAPATIAGVLVAVVAVLWPAAAAVLAWAAGLPAWAIAVVARVAADQPWASLPWPRGPGGALLLAGITVLLLAGAPALGHAARARPAVALVLVVLGLGAGVPVRDVAWPLPGWRLVACDVGQGDGIVLATSPGHAVLVDTGPDPALMDACLDRLGIQELDALLLTHFHADHVQGLPGVLRGRRVREVLTSPIGEPDEQAQQVRAWAGAAGVPVAPLYAGDHLAWPGLRARVWWPARLIREGSVPNNASLVLTAQLTNPDAAPASEGPGPPEGPHGPEAPDRTALQVALLGDIEQQAAQAVLAALRRDPSPPPPPDVLKVAHHGSANRDDALLDALAAPVAVICVGTGNDYGHPAPSTLAALQRRGFRILRTDLDGDVAIARADPELLVATRGPG